jgi:hypothetical protein
MVLAATNGSVAFVLGIVVVFAILLLTPGRPFGWSRLFRGRRPPSSLGDPAADPVAEFKPPPDETEP